MPPNLPPVCARAWPFAGITYTNKGKMFARLVRDRSSEFIELAGEGWHARAGTRGHIPPSRHPTVPPSNHGTPHKSRPGRSPRAAPRRRFSLTHGCGPDAVLQRALDERGRGFGLGAAYPAADPLPMTHGAPGRGVPPILQLQSCRMLSNCLPSRPPARPLHPQSPPPAHLPCLGQDSLTPSGCSRSRLGSTRTTRLRPSAT